MLDTRTSPTHFTSVAQAEAIRVYTKQKQLGRDAELAAQEIVRRAERGIGLAIRRGQEEGRFLRPGQTVRRPGPEHQGCDVTSVTTGQYFDHNHQRSQVLSISAGVPDDQFEAALEEANGAVA